MDKDSMEKRMDDVNKIRDCCGKGRHHRHPTTMDAWTVSAVWGKKNVAIGAVRWCRERDSNPHVRTHTRP